MHLVIVNLVVTERHLNGSLSVALLFDLPAASVDATQEPRNDTSIRKTFTATHRVCFPSPGDTVCKYRDVESIEEVFDRGRHWITD